MLAPTFSQKTLATAQAEAALAGAVLQRIEADDGKPLLVLTREAFTGQFNNIKQVRNMLAGLSDDVEAENV